MSACESLFREETCRELKGFTHSPALRRSCNPGCLVPQGSINNRSMSSAMSLVAARNGNLAVSIIPGTEPGSAEHVHQNANFARSIVLHTDLAARNGNLFVSVIPGTEPVTAQHVPQNDYACSIVPHTDLGLADSVCLMNDTTRSCAFCTTSAANGSSHFAAANGPSHCSSITADPFRPDTRQDDALMTNPELYNGVSGEPRFLFSARLHSVRHRENKKQRLEGFSLPDSLARNFDRSEMDKIAKAIVRVNKYGSSTATKRGYKSGSSPQACAFKRTTPRVLPSVGAFTVQCAKCFNWRLIPSKEQYEQIRQDILEKPFLCTNWRPGASCDDPPELGEDSNLLWAIDKPSIPLPPNGWERLLVIRGEGCSKFADIYYVAPTGKKLRSMPEIERYLSENPELVARGVSLSQFSFSSPRAQDENYCRKRSNAMRGSISPNIISTLYTGVLGSRQSQEEQFLLNGAENAPLAVEPLRAWDFNHNALMIGHHDSGEFEGLGNV